MIEKIATPKNTLAIIQKYDFIFQKRFGQNFLIDSNILDKIVLGAKLTKEDVVIEVGPGIGSLTQALAESAKKVIAIEIDKKLIPILEETLGAYDNVRIINQDILKIDLKALIQEENEGRPVKVVANLPYYITTPIIMNIFEQHVPVESITVMVQKEVAERLQAKPGSKDYGAITLAIQYYSQPQIITHVGHHCFIPAPKVGSSVIQLVKNQTPYDVADEALLFKIIKAAFSQRRKTLMNCLTSAEELNFSKEAILSGIKALGLDERVRGEVLSLEQFMALTKHLKAQLNNAEIS